MSSMWGAAATAVMGLALLSPPLCSSKSQSLYIVRTLPASSTVQTWQVCDGNKLACNQAQPAYAARDATTTMSTWLTTSHVVAMHREDSQPLPYCNFMWAGPLLLV